MFKMHLGMAIIGLILQQHFGNCETANPSNISIDSGSIKKEKSIYPVSYLIKLSKLFWGTNLSPALLCRPSKLQWSHDITRHHLRVKQDVFQISNEDDINIVVCLDHFEESEIIGLLKEWKPPKHHFHLLLIMNNETNELVTGLKAAISPFARIFFFNDDQKLFFESYIINGHRIKRDLARVLVHEEGLEMKVLQNKAFLERRSDLQGLKLRAVTVHALKYMEDRKGGIDLSGPLFISSSGEEMVTLDVRAMKGVFVDVLAKLSQSMNFSCHLFTRKDQQYGWRFPNGSWAGILGNLEKSEADIAIAPLAILEERKTVLTYLPPLAPEHYALYIKRDGLEKMDLLTFFRPFRLGMWLGILAMVGALSLVLTLVEHSFNAIKMNCWLQSMKELGKNMWRVSSSLLGNRSIHTMSLPEREKMQGYRLLLLVSALFGVLILACFRSSVTSELSVFKVQLPFDSFEGLLHSHYKLTSDEFYFYSIGMMKNYGAESHVIDAVMEKFESFARYNRIEFKDMEEKFFPHDDLVFFHSKALMEMHPNLECRLHLVWQTSHPVLFAPAVPKTSELVEILTYQTEYLLEYGFIHNTNKRLMSQERCEKSNVKAISIQKLAAPTALMLFVLALLPILLLCEVVANKMRREKQNSQE